MFNLYDTDTHIPHRYSFLFTHSLSLDLQNSNLPINYFKRNSPPTKEKNLSPFIVSFVDTIPSPFPSLSFLPVHSWKKRISEDRKQNEWKEWASTSLSKTLPFNVSVNQYNEKAANCGEQKSLERMCTRGEILSDMGTAMTLIIASNPWENGKASNPLR